MKGDSGLNYLKSKAMQERCIELGADLWWTGNAMMETE
jgi:hypothetical protein